MFKVPIKAIKLDIDNIELYEDYNKLVNDKRIDNIYLAGDIGGLRELTNSLFFELIAGSDIYYCDELSIYFSREGNMKQVVGNEIIDRMYSRYGKYHEFFDKVYEIIERDKEISANRQLLLLKKGKIFTEQK